MYIFLIENTPAFKVEFDSFPPLETRKKVFIVGEMEFLSCDTLLSKISPSFVIISQWKS